MMPLCRTRVMIDFYPREIGKIMERIRRFESVKQYWGNKQDIWI